MPGGFEPAVEATPAYRQSGGWGSARIRGGGYLQHLVFAPRDRNVVYMTVDVGGIYRSDDGGLPWYMRHTGPPQVTGGAAACGAAVDSA